MVEESSLANEPLKIEPKDQHSHELNFQAEKETTEISQTSSNKKSEEDYVVCQSTDCQTTIFEEESLMEKTVMPDLKQNSENIDSSDNENDQLTQSASSTSIQLNLSSMSMSMNQTPSKEPTSASQESENYGKFSRQSSTSSIFSHISSVSQQGELTDEEDEEEDVEDKPGRRRGLRKRQIGSHMDDNELSITKKATEVSDELDEANKPGKSRVKRIKSDLTSSRRPKSQNAAQIKAKLEKIPETFGTNEQEIRLTRSKLKSLVEDNVEGEKTPVRSSTRITRSVKKSDNEATEPKSAKMSISNLRKFDKMLAAKEKDKTSSDFIDPTPIKIARAGRSPSPSASSCISSSTVQSVTTRTLRSRPRKEPSTPNQNDNEKEKVSPVYSIVSNVSSAASSARKRSSLQRSGSFESEKTPSISYNLRSKGRPSLQRSADVNLPRRGRLTNNPDTNLNKINENSDTSDDEMTLQEIHSKKK